MNLQEIVDQLHLTQLTDRTEIDAVIPTGGYASDLLSCVIAGAKKGDVWVTLQAHVNIVAVAALLEVSAIIITENAQPEESVILKAKEENVILLSTHASTFEVVGNLWEKGLRVG